MAGLVTPVCVGGSREAEVLCVLLDDGEALAADFADARADPGRDDDAVDAHRGQLLELVERYRALDGDGRELARLVLAPGVAQLLTDTGDVRGIPVPAVAERGRPPHRGRSATADVDREPRLLHRLRLEADRREVEELTVELGALVGEEHA